MQATHELRVADVEHITVGVIITFTDGRCAIYSAALLDSVFKHAERVPGSDEDEMV